MIPHPTRRVSEVLAAIALALVATVLTRCAKPETVIIKQPIIIEKTIVAKPTRLAPAGSAAAKVVSKYRQLEQKVPDSVGFPNATSEQIRTIYDSQRRLNRAAQTMINHDGHATRADHKRATDAIDDLDRALAAPMLNAPIQGTPEELRP